MRPFDMRPITVAVLCVLASACTLQRDRPYCLGEGSAFCVAFTEVDYPAEIRDGGP